MPGTVSRLMRNWGTKNAWRTSFDERMTLTGLPTRKGLNRKLVGQTDILGKDRRRFLVKGLWHGKRILQTDHQR